MRCIFLGTPQFAVPTLERMITAGHEVALVVTQPDRPKGRGNTLAMSASQASRLSGLGSKSSSRNECGVPTP